MLRPTIDCAIWEACGVVRETVILEIDLTTSILHELRRWDVIIQWLVVAHFCLGDWVDEW